MSPPESRLHSTQPCPLSHPQGCPLSLSHLFIGVCVCVCCLLPLLEGEPAPSVRTWLAGSCHGSKSMLNGRLLNDRVSDPRRTLVLSPGLPVDTDAPDSLSESCTHSHCVHSQGLPAPLRLPAALGLLVRSAHPSHHQRQLCPRCHTLLVTRNTHCLGQDSPRGSSWASLPRAQAAHSLSPSHPGQAPALALRGPFTHSRWLCGLLQFSPFNTQFFFVILRPSGKYQMGSGGQGVSGVDPAEGGG